MPSPASDQAWRERYRSPDDEAAREGYRSAAGRAWLPLYLRRLLTRLGCDDAGAAGPGCGQAAAVDVGCGHGAHVALLHEMGFRVTGVDYSPALLAAAQTRLTGRPVGLVAADLQALPLADASQDLVVCMGVLQHVPDLPAALREAARVLRPGGRLLVEARNRYSAFRAVQRVLRGKAYRELDASLRSFSPARLRDELGRAGFERVRAHGCYVFPPPLGLLSWLTFRLRVERAGAALFPLTQWLSHNFWVSGVRRP